MQDTQTHGAIDQSHINRKTDYLFRVSMKALIRDPDGNVLVVKETGRDWWDMPGGGMDHEEDIKTAIARELFEEVSLAGNFTYQVIAVEDPAFLKHAGVWQIRLVFEVVPENMTFTPGEDGDEVAFIDPETLKDSESIAERNVYVYSRLASH